MSTNGHGGVLLLPHGLQRKKVADLSAEEMAWLAMGEDVLPKLGLTLACTNCLRAGQKTGAVLRGQNDTTDAVLTVTCDCRRLSYRAKADPS